MLFRRIETDLRSVVFRSAPLSSTGSTGSTGSGSGGSGSAGSQGSTAASSGSNSTSGSSTSGTTEPADAYSTQKTGLFGDSQSLVVHISLPNRAGRSLVTAPATSSQTGLPPSDLQSIAYFLAGSSSPLA